jgi:hypothetical protein
MSISCQELARRIEELQPEAHPRDVARLCLLLSNSVTTLDEFRDNKRLTDAWHDTGLKLQAATDQHAAMTDELDALTQSDPRKFTADQIWVLIRAIKVQSQILQMYVGEAQLRV